jgi:hypothetical protein
MLLCRVVCSLASSPGKALADLYPDSNLYPDPDIYCHLNRNYHHHTDPLGDLASRYAQLNANPVSHPHSIRHTQSFADNHRNHAAFCNGIQHTHLHRDDATQPDSHSNRDSPQPYQLSNSDRNAHSFGNTYRNIDTRGDSAGAANGYTVRAVD